VTKPRKHIGILPGLPWAARKWLLGARPYFTDGDPGELRNSGIVRLRHLVVGGGDEDWERYLAALQKEYGPLVREKRRPKNALGRLGARPGRPVKPAAIWRPYRRDQRGPHATLPGAERIRNGRAQSPGSVGGFFSVDQSQEPVGA
jgi:hypothetical protein